jgi:hypothetical protein
MSDAEKIHGLSLAEWQASHRAGIQEFAAPMFSFSRDGSFLRIAFGHAGPWVNERTREPVYTHAVTMTEFMAIEMARQILHTCAAPIPPTSPPAKTG